MNEILVNCSAVLARYVKESYTPVGTYRGGQLHVESEMRRGWFGRKAFVEGVFDSETKALQTATYCRAPQGDSSYQDRDILTLKRLDDGQTGIHREMRQPNLFSAVSLNTDVWLVADAHGEIEHMDFNVR